MMHEIRADNAFPFREMDLEKMLRSDPAVLSFQEQEAVVAIDPNDFFMELLAGSLARFTFHVISNEILMGSRLEDLSQKAEKIEVLELEPLDIKQNPEKAAWAVQNQALFAFKNQTVVEDETCPVMKVSPLFEDLIRAGCIKQLKMKNHEGLVERTFERDEVDFVHYSAEEIQQVSSAIFRSVALSYKIRDVQAVLKEQERQRKKDSEELLARERRLQDLMVFQRMARVAASLGHEPMVAPLRSGGGLTNSFCLNSIIEILLKEQAEKRKDEKEVVAREDLQERIIRDSIRRSILKREAAMHEHLHTEMFDSTMICRIKMIFSA